MSTQGFPKRGAECRITVTLFCRSGNYGLPRRYAPRNDDVAGYARALLQIIDHNLLVDPLNLFFNTFLTSAE